MRNDLHRRAEVIAPALPGDDLLIDPAGRNIVVTQRRPAREALVMTEIEIGLCAILGDKNLAMLIGTHRPGIDIEIRIELAQPDGVTARLKQRPERRRREPLAKRRHHAAGNENKPRHGPWRLPCFRRFGETNYAAPRFMHINPAVTSATAAPMRGAAV